MLVGGLYQLPVMMGYGDHWSLNPEEAKVISSQLEACLNSLPSRRVDQAVKFITQTAPWVGLTASVFVVTYARIQETRRRAHVAGRPPESVPGGSGPSPNGTSASNGAPSGHVSPRIADIFGSGQG
jgi:hypothetical protein